MILRGDRPYSHFNFLVKWKDTEGNCIEGGFQEVTGLSQEHSTFDCGEESESVHDPLKLPGSEKMLTVTCRRGVVQDGVLLAHWVEVRQKEVLPFRYSVTITLLNEKREPMGQRWRLHNAYPFRYSGPSLLAKGGGDVAVEELVLSVEGLELEQDE